MVSENILVWGLGYVGSVSAACFSKIGFNVTGIDNDINKITAFQRGLCPINEIGLSEIFSEKNNNFKATINLPINLDNFDFSMVCVGTPSLQDGEPNLIYLDKVCKDIGILLKKTSRFHTVIIRSTVFAGVTNIKLKKILESHSGKVAGIDFGLTMNPEFLREATAVKDFLEPPYTVIGGLNQKSIDHVKMLYKSIPGKIFEVELEEAEILKVVNNAFHATKITFANEIGRLCESLNINSNKIMEIVCADKKLNISNAYLKPGFAFGGSCLPKDLRALNYHGDLLNVKLPMLNNVLNSNNEQIEHVLEYIKNYKKSYIGVLGLSFKSGTDDLRESPTIKMVKLMIENGYKVLIYDNKIKLDRIFGSNLQYLENSIPNYIDIMVDDLDIIYKKCSKIIIANSDDKILEFVKSLDATHKIVDLIGMSDEGF